MGSKTTKTLFQILDNDQDAMGLILTDTPEEEFEETAKEYFYKNVDLPEDSLKKIGYPDDLSVDGVVELLILKGYEAERMYTENIYI